MCRGSGLSSPRSTRLTMSAHATTRQLPLGRLKGPRVVNRLGRAPSEAGGVAFGCAGAFRIGLQSGVHVACIGPPWPCIGHRTGYSLHENARISGLASADFEGVFARSYKRWRPRLFLRALMDPAHSRTVAIASADFEGVFAHSYKRCRPRLFLRALRKEPS